MEDAASGIQQLAKPFNHRRLMRALEALGKDSCPLINDRRQSGKPPIWKYEDTHNVYYVK